MSEVLKRWIKEASEPLVVYTDYGNSVDVTKVTVLLKNSNGRIEVGEIWEEGTPYCEHDIFAEIVKEAEDGSSDRSAEAQANEADA